MASEEPDPQADGRGEPGRAAGLPVPALDAIEAERAEIERRRAAEEATIADGGRDGSAGSFSS